MADLTINSISVEDEQSQTTLVPVGEPASPGTPLYFSAADDMHMIADSNVDEESAEADGILLSTVAAAGDLGLVLLRGVLDFGSAVNEGTIYVLSNNAGKICPVEDLASGSWLTILGWGLSSSEIRIRIIPTQTQVDGPLPTTTAGPTTT